MKDLKKSGRPAKLLAAIRKTIEDEMRANDKKTSKELKVKIEQDHQIKLGCSIVRRARKKWESGRRGKKA